MCTARVTYLERVDLRTQYPFIGSLVWVKEAGTLLVLKYTFER